MTTTIDIPPELLRQTMRHAKSSDEREAVLRALEDFIRRHRQSELIPYLGTFHDFLTPRAHSFGCGDDPAEHQRDAAKLDQ